MKWYYKSFIALFIICMAGGLVNSANHYHGLYKNEQYRANKAESLANQRQATIDDMQVRQRDISALDIKHTGELADAKEMIERLRGDVINGHEQMQFNATCSKTVSGNMRYAESPKNKAGAELSYFRLRDGINAASNQVNYQQDFIRLQCLR